MPPTASLITELETLTVLELPAVAAVAPAAAVPPSPTTALTTVPAVSLDRSA